MTSPPNARRPAETGGPLRERLRQLALSGDLEADAKQLEDAGFTDGLLVTSPTEARVNAYLDAADPASVAVGPIPLAMATPTAWDLAACAVMAGCPPASFAVAVAALEALTAPEFNLLGVQTTTSGVAPLLVVSGDVTLDSTGSVPTLTIGRAVRLALHVLGNVLPGVSNLSTQGHPGKLSWCITESPESPWPALHSDRLDGAARAVTAVAGVGSVESVLGQADVESDVELLAHACAAVRSAGLGRRVARQQAVVVLPPEVAQRFDRAGWDRRHLAAELAERADELLEQWGGPPPARGDTTGPLGSAEGAHGTRDVLVVVSGGIGIKGTVVQTWGSGTAVCAPVR
jgi:hypothetical protein